MQGYSRSCTAFEQMLCEISGMDRFTFQPGGGSQAVYANARMIRAYHEARGEGHRDEIITTIFSHPCDARVPGDGRLQGRHLYPGETGLSRARRDQGGRLRAYRRPDDHEPRGHGHLQPAYRRDRRASSTTAGGLCHYDQANANGILGITRARDAGFDLCQFNLHKTFSSPHCSMGMPCRRVGRHRGARAASCRRRPSSSTATGIVLDYDRPHSIGKVRAFHGVAGHGRPLATPGC